MPYNLIIPSISLNFNAFSLSILPFFGFDLVSHFFFGLNYAVWLSKGSKFKKKKIIPMKIIHSMACGELSHLMVWFIPKKMIKTVNNISLVEMPQWKEICIWPMECGNDINVRISKISKFYRYGCSLCIGEPFFLEPLESDLFHNIF